MKPLVLACVGIVCFFLSAVFVDGAAAQSNELDPRIRHDVSACYETLLHRELENAATTQHAYVLVTVEADGRTHINAKASDERFRGCVERSARGWRFLSPGTYDLPFSFRP